MESALKRAAADAAALSSSLEAEITAALVRAPGGAMAGGGNGNPLGLGASGGSIGAGTYQRNDMTQHTEQYRHNSGWVAASIKPIASRIARQPVRVARVLKKAPAKTPGAFVQKAQGAKPWEIKSADESARVMWFKRALPGSYKQLAPDAELISSHPFVDAINEPNDIMVRWSLFYVTVSSLLLTGKAYWWVTERVRNPDDASDANKPLLEIWPVPASWVRPIHTEQKLFSHYEITPEGTSEPQRAEACEIIYFSLPDPQNPLAAKSVLQDAARAVITDEAIAEAQRRGFANGIFPGFAVVVGRTPEVNGVPGDRPALNGEQRAQILTAFKQAYRGAFHNGEPVILDRIIEDIRRISNTNAEMDFMGSGQYTKERITQNFGVNPISMGQVEGANRASSATADDHLCSNTVNPLIENISQTATKWLQNFDAPGEKTYVFIEEARAVDPDSDRNDWLALFNSGACSIDELRAGVGNLPPVVGGDKRYMKTGVVELDGRLASEAPEPVAPVVIGTAPAPQQPAALPPAPGSAERPAEAPALPAQPPSDDPARNSEPVVAGANSVSDTALNGAQIASLLEVLDKLAAGEYPREAVEQILAASFPMLDVEMIRRIISAIEAAPKPTTEGEQGAAAGKWHRVSKDAGAVVRVLASIRKSEATAVPIEDFRQREPFDCGAAAGYAVAHAQGCEPGDYRDFMVALDTEDEVGTTPDDLFAYFAHQGCAPRRGANRSVEYLRNEIRRGRLCLCPVQYFGDGDASGGEGGAGYDSGHWITVYGYTAEGLLYLDPIDGFGEIGNNEFVGNWYDRGQAGQPFLRYAITVGPKPKPTIDPPTN